MVVYAAVYLVCVNQSIKACPNLHKLLEPLGHEKVYVAMGERNPDGVPLHDFIEFCEMAQTATAVNHNLNPTSTHAAADIKNEIIDSAAGTSVADVAAKGVVEPEEPEETEETEEQVKAKVKAKVKAYVVDSAIAR